MSNGKKTLKLTLVFKVPNAEIAKGFSQQLVARMHKYLAKHSTVVHAVDVEIN